MADNAPVSPILKQQESATTREELDFDEDAPEQETGRVSPLGHETTTANPKPTPSPTRKSVTFQEDEAPPAKPPRPLSPQQQAENTLIEAFPSIDTKVIKAVLNASGGKVEPAFNALLGMSDPDATVEEQAPPSRPPRPTQREPMSQMEADELYARQLAEQYNSEYPRAQTRYNQREPGRRGVNQQRQQSYDDPDSPERNFFDDDLPEIGRNIQQGFFETQKKFNSWIGNLKKQFDGDEEDEDLYSSSQSGSRANTGLSPGRQNFGPSQRDQMYGIQKRAEQQQARRSTEAQRYDADPHEFQEEEFERLELRDEENAPPPAMPPRTSSRKAPNPDLFKSTPNAPSGPIDEVDAADRGDDKAKKWQPLTSVQPHPEDDNDPFSLGDDDDGEKGEDLRKEDSARLKEKARNSISTGDATPGKPLEESEMSGTKNKDAEALLGGEKK
jgi:hypothetical protein